MSPPYVRVCLSNLINTSSYPHAPIPRAPNPLEKKEKKEAAPSDEFVVVVHHRLNK